jgi:hypothetical protein
MISLYDRCDCHYERRCRRPADTWCLGTIAAGEVETAVERVLSQAQGPRPKAQDKQ